MRRGIGILLAAIAAFGCTSHKSASVPSAASSTTTRGATTTSILPEGTWTFGSGGAGFAVGEMHITGGPPPRNAKQHDQPLPGIVEVHHPGEIRVLTRVTVGGSGRFNIDLPVGNYVLVGRPANRGIMSMKSAIFAIEVGRTSHVDLLELAT